MNKIGKLITNSAYFSKFKFSKNSFGNYFFCKSYLGPNYDKAFIFENEKVKSMMIGTHTSDVKHDKLVELLKENNWKIMYNYRRNTLTNTDFGDVHFNDGFLYLKNQKF